MGYLLHSGATVICSHGGQASPTSPYTRVTVSNQPVTTQTPAYLVAGCPYAPGGTPTPCVTAQWVTSALRVKAGGQPVLLQDSQAVTSPNGVSLNVVATQTRAKGT